MAETGKNTVNKNRLVPITVRFTVGAIEAIGDVAHKHSMTKAEIVRLAVDGRLSTYLGSLVYVDNKKAQNSALLYFILGSKPYGLDTKDLHG